MEFGGVVYRIMEHSGTSLPSDKSDSPLLSRFVGQLWVRTALQKQQHLHGAVVAHTFNLNIQAAEAGGSL